MTFCRFSGVPLSRFCGLYVFLLEIWNARKAAIHDASSSPGDGGMRQAGRAQSVLPCASGRCRAHTRGTDSEATPDRLALSRLDRSSFSRGRSPSTAARRRKNGFADGHCPEQSRSEWQDWAVNIGPNGTRHLPCRRGTRGQFLQLDTAQTNGRLWRWPSAIGRRGKTVGIRGRAGGLGQHAQPRAHLTGPGRPRDARKISRRCLPRLSQVCQNSNKWRESLGFLSRSLVHATRQTLRSLTQRSFPGSCGSVWPGGRTGASAG
jgi:hypothetical protein